MSATYFALLTNIGAAKLANATTLGSRLNITRMAVGDGGGSLPVPNPAQTTLINEKRRAALNTLSVDPKNPSQIIAEQVIPENEGGFWIREIGLFDDDGNLIAVANCPETYKPQLQEGSGRIQTVRMILIVSSTDAVTLKIDPAVVLATRGYVDEVIEAHEKSRKHPDGTLTAKGFVQLSNATNSDSETLAATPKAVKAVNDNANGRVPSGRKVNGKALTADITLSAGDVGAYTKLETDTAVSVVAAAANNAATAAASANTNANGRVPSGRTVNGKALTADITLGAGDVGALPTAGTAVAAAKLATIRTINGVAFDGTANITLPWDFPTGAPVPYPLPTPPPGWIKCNGQPFNKATYPQLASAYPSGVLPDLRGEFVRGWDDGRGVDAGRALLSAQSYAIHSHSHSYRDRYFAEASNGINMGNMPSKEAMPDGYQNIGAKGPDFDNDYFLFIDSVTGITGNNETRPRNIAFNYIVRAA